ncbi:MAG: putative lipid II flippase FtsW [Bacteriovoracia bacterium]
MKNAGIISRNSSLSYKQDSTLLIAIFALVSAGLVMVYSSSFILAQEQYRDGLYFLKRHVFFLSFGLLSFFIGFKLRTEKLKKLSTLVFILAIGLLIATFVPGVSRRAGGASRWISFGFFGFQPSEFAKFAAILFIARTLDRKSYLQDNFRTGFLTYFITILPIYFLLLLQPDFGTTALLLCTTVCMITACGVRFKYLLASIGVLIPTAAILILSSPYRKARVLGFLDPWADPGHKGFQIIQSWLAFFSGKWLGVGVGNSHEKLFYLPKAHNDFIFAVIAEEWGLVGVIFFIFLFLLILWRGLQIATKQTETFERALATGIASMLGLQAFFNMAVVMGLLPTKGLPLPLVSYGGSSIVCTLFMLGVLLRLSSQPMQKEKLTL